MALGILLSRVAGLVRQRVLAYYLGLGDAADAVAAAFRIPNLVQNLLGEGSLSAAFIPVYARLRAGGREADALAVAKAIAALLAVATTLVVLLGMLAAPWLVDLLSPGFAGAKRDLTIRLVRMLFPGVGLLVMSAWCLGVLNSHGRFFLSYAAPVVWNLAIIAAAIAGAGQGPDLPLYVAWGAVAGSALQLAVQVPAVLTLFPAMPSGDASQFREVVRAFGPAVLSRGVVQLGAWFDLFVASLLGTGAVAALANAQMLGLLPVSLFGMAVSAAALPAMARERAADDEARAAEAIRRQVETGWTRIAVFVVPSAAAFVLLGEVLASVVFQTGAFRAEDSRYLWWILAGSGVGLLATTTARLAASASFALGDTRTPLRTATIRLAVGMAVGVPLALVVPRAIGLDPRLGAAGLTLAAGLAGWIELVLLRRALAPRLGALRLGAGNWLRLWGAALAAAAAAWGVRLLTPPAWGPLWGGLPVLATFGLTYLLLVRIFGGPSAEVLRFDRRDR